MNTQQPVLRLESARQTSLTKLIAHSHEGPMDFNASLDWHVGVDKTRPPKLPEHCWLFGTEAYACLDSAQRLELLWLEIARDVSMFIALEQTIPVLYVGYLNQYERALPPEIYEYLMIFSKEEIVHTLVFKRYMELGRLPRFEPDASVTFALSELPAMHPVAGVLFTLIIEWTAELGAVYSTQAAIIDPLTRQLFQRHHVDEARHIAFAKWIVEAYFASEPPERVNPLREMVRQQIKRLLPTYTYAPMVAKHSSYEFPVRMDDMAQIQSIWHSPANVELNRRRLAPMFGWMKKLDML
jgi:hypothetical protein